MTAVLTMYPCTHEECDAAFKKKWRLVEHMVKHTGKKPFCCPEVGCDRSFGRKSHLQRHQKNHLPNKDFQCPEDGCHCQFVSKETLNHHLKRVHKEKTSRCAWPGCGKAFKKHQQLRSHTAQHDGTLPHVCDHEGCNKAFLNPSKLRAHKKTHQGYVCDVPGCGVIVYKWTDMRRHKNDAHGKSFCCDKCDKTFNTNAKLGCHSKVHNAEREVFECPYEDCTRSYTRVSYLQQHVSNYHEGARPYACSNEGCVKTFAYKRSLLEHRVVHEPGYCKPPSNPKRKRTLASRLSGFPDAATYNISWFKLDKKMRKTGALEQGSEGRRVPEERAGMSNSVDMESGDEDTSTDKDINMRAIGPVECEEEEISDKNSEMGSYVNLIHHQFTTIQDHQNGDVDLRIENSPTVVDISSDWEYQAGEQSTIEHWQRKDTTQGSMTNTPVMLAEIVEIAMLDPGSSSRSSNWVSSGTHAPIMPNDNVHTSERHHQGESGTILSESKTTFSRSTMCGSGEETGSEGGFIEATISISNQSEMIRSDVNRNNLEGTVDPTVEHSEGPAKNVVDHKQSQQMAGPHVHSTHPAGFKSSKRLQQKEDLEVEVFNELDEGKKLLGLGCPITDRLNM